MNCTPECDNSCTQYTNTCGSSGLLIAVVLYVLLAIILSSFTGAY